MLAATETVDLARLLLDLLIVVAAAKLAAEGAERLRIPPVLGEIVAGIVVGPSVLGLIELGGERGVSLGVLAEIGVLLLLVQVGMEMDLGELGRVGKASLLVAVIGVVAPFVVGTGAGVALGQDTETAIFLGAALTATSVGLTARVFGDLRALATVEARVVLGAAVADDVLGLIILTIVVKVVTGDSITAGLVGWTVLVAVGFLALAGVFGLMLVPRALAFVHRFSRSGTTLTVAALAVILGFAVLADGAQLAFIIGAFMAGIAIGRSDHHGQVGADLHIIGGVFIPVFFVLIGVNTELDAMLRPTVLLTAGVLLVVAVAGKIVSGMGAVGIRSDRLLIGFGMIPRGEVGLIFASIGLTQGVLDDELYGALLLVVLLTTVMTPPLLRWRIGAGSAVDVIDLDVDATPEPAGGWVLLRDRQIMLTGHPPVAAIVPVALQAAALADAGRPSEELLEWFADRRGVALTWTAADTPALLDLLRRGSARSVRFLEVTGVLERGVPDIARAIARRRADPSELDPGGVLRFPTVARLEELMADSAGTTEPGRGDHGRTPALAALVVDVAGPDADETAVRRLLDQLAVTDRRRVERLLSAARLLRAAAADLEGYGPAEVRQLATHVGSAARGSDAYLLAVALAPPDDLHREALDELYALVADLLRHPDLLGERADSLAAARRTEAEALAEEPAAIVRLQSAPVSYLLAHEPDELARQARLVAPLPAAGTVRVAVSPEGTPDHWVIDVACRDADGLLARLAAHADRRRVRHRRRHGGDLAGRRRCRHVRRPLGRAAPRPLDGRADGGGAAPPPGARAAHRPHGDVRQHVAAVAHRVHRHRAGSPRHARRPGRGVRRRRRGGPQRTGHERRPRSRRPLLVERSARPQARRPGDRPRRGGARRQSPPPRPLPHPRLLIRVFPADRVSPAGHPRRKHSDRPLTRARTQHT